MIEPITAIKTSQCQLKTALIMKITSKLFIQQRLNKIRSTLEKAIVLTLPVYF